MLRPLLPTAEAEPTVRPPFSGSSSLPSRSFAGPERADTTVRATEGSKASTVVDSYPATLVLTFVS